MRSRRGIRRRLRSGASVLRDQEVSSGGGLELRTLGSEGMSSSKFRIIVRVARTVDRCALPAAVKFPKGGCYVQFILGSSPRLLAGGDHVGRSGTQGLLVEAIEFAFFFFVAWLSDAGTTVLVHFRDSATSGMLIALLPNFSLFNFFFFLPLRPPFRLNFVEICEFGDEKQFPLRKRLNLIRWCRCWKHQTVYELIHLLNLYIIIRG